MTIEPIEVDALIREVCKNMNEEIIKGNISGSSIGTGEVSVCGYIVARIGPYLGR